MRNAVLALSPFALVAPLALLASPAAAQEAANPYAACAAMRDNAQRLACFDSTYAAQSVAIAAREEREGARRENLFGFRDQEAVAAREEAEGAGLAITVSEVLRNSRRDQILLLDNGQLWREIDGSTMRNRVREGWAGTVSQHWSGAYEIRFEGRFGYLRVARIR